MQTLPMNWERNPRSTGTSAELSASGQIGWDVRECQVRMGLGATSSTLSGSLLSLTARQEVKKWAANKMKEG